MQGIEWVLVALIVVIVPAAIGAATTSSKSAALLGTLYGTLLFAAFTLPALWDANPSSLDPGMILRGLDMVPMFVAGFSLLGYGCKKLFKGKSSDAR